MSLLINEAQLQAMTNAIVQSADPRRVILFGSVANGTATVDSDLDFLVVEDEPFSASRSRRREAAKIWRALMPYPFPKDVLVYTTEEVERFSREESHLIKEAMATGRVLYER